MGWDVMLINFDGTLEDLAKAGEFPPLGGYAEVRDHINRVLNQVEWDDEYHGIFRDENLSFEITYGLDPVQSIKITVRGQGPAVELLMRLARPKGWRVLDFSTGEFIDPDHPELCSWGDVQAFQRHVDSLYESPDDESRPANDLR